MSSIANQNLRFFVTVGTLTLLMYTIMTLMNRKMQIILLHTINFYLSIWTTFTEHSLHNNGIDLH